MLGSAARAHRVCVPSVRRGAAIGEERRERARGCGAGRRVAGCRPWRTSRRGARRRWPGPGEGGAQRHSVWCVHIPDRAWGQTERSLRARGPKAEGLRPPARSLPTCAMTLGGISHESFYAHSMCAGLMFAEAPSWSLAPSFSVQWAVSSSNAGHRGRIASCALVRKVLSSTRATTSVGTCHLQAGHRACNEKESELTATRISCIPGLHLETLAAFASSGHGVRAGREAHLNRFLPPNWQRGSPGWVHLGSGRVGGTP